MPSTTPIPTAVKIVAWLFIMLGVSSALEMVVGLMQWRITLQSGVLGIFVGRGVLRGVDGWRRLAFWLSAITTVWCIALAVWMLVRGEPVEVKVVGVLVGHVSGWIGAIQSVAFAALYLWTTTVLASEPTKRASLGPALS
jgi:hypothetical protein